MSSLRIALVLLPALPIILSASHPAFGLPTTVARADFNADAIGNPPDTSLPGDPEGDSLVLLGSQWMAVVDSSGAMTDQPVEFVRTSGGVGSPKLSATWAPGTYDCTTWTMRWCSMARTPIPPIFFVLRGDIPEPGREGGRGTRVSASMLTRGSAIKINTTAGETTVASWTLDDPDCFEWTVDLVAQKTSLSIDGVMVAEDLDIPGQAGFEVSHFGIESSMTTPFTYVLDDIEILAESCPTPVEPATWGRLKAAYR